jgi:hypothetical protein
MRNRLLLFLLATSFFSFVDRTMAQTQTDGIMMSKGEICFGAIYNHESWDQYWEGTLLRENGNIGTFTRQTVLPMFALGLTDKLNLIAQAPWVATEASQGQLKGVSGFSDFSVFLKAQAFHFTLGPGKLAFNPTVGFSFPMSNYLEDYAPFSLGLGCTDLTLRANLQYKLNMGIYARGTVAYEVRGTSTIERDYYYTTHGIYADKVDVPNAVNYTATLGAWLLKNSLNVDVTFDGQTTEGGNDIRRQDVGFPSNKMNFTRIGAFAHYYFNFIPGLGILGGVNQIQDGRNVGKSMAFYAGVTYQFQIFNKEMEESSTN